MHEAPEQLHAALTSHGSSAGLRALQRWLGYLLLLVLRPHAPLGHSLSCTHASVISGDNSVCSCSAFALLTEVGMFMLECGMQKSRHTAAAPDQLEQHHIRESFSGIRLHTHCLQANSSTQAAHMSTVLCAGWHAGIQQVRPELSHAHHELHVGTLLALLVMMVLALVRPLVRLVLLQTLLA